MMSGARNATYWLILVAVLITAGYHIYDTYEKSRPCVEPVRYSIGNVDERFNVSDRTLRSSALSAANIWNSAGGKTLVEYDPTAELKINLVYDEREATAELGQQISTIQAAQSLTRARLEADQAEYLVSQQAYNSRVTTINARGGATRKEGLQLDQELAVLNRTASLLSARTVAYNAELAQLNKLIEKFNLTAGRTYEEGNYVRDKDGERINIFVVVDRDQLTRVLAHELGHAIGLGHNDDPNSIMYAKNESGNLTPSESDLSDLEDLCRLKDLAKQ